jgi:hypothetical protein
MNKKTFFLLVILVLGFSYRFFSVYPTSPSRFAPASCALQACWIYEGDRPVFYSGQAWMGPAGNYLIALMYKFLGISSLTLSLFAWLMSTLFYLLTVLLALRLFGTVPAIITAFLFMIPNDRMMYLSGQPRSHYELCFVMTPVLFLMTISLIKRFQTGKKVRLYSFFLGLVSGVAFWNNMAIGPAIAVSGLVLLIHLKWDFFKHSLLFYLCGSFIGFFPVIYYNLTKEMVLTGQANIKNVTHLADVLKAFITNTYPYFWGIEFRKISHPLILWISIAFLVWIALCYVLVFIQAVKKVIRREEPLGYEIIFGYLFLHLLISSVSSYGKRFGDSSNPISYIMNLYAVAFTIPAVIVLFPWKKWMKILFLFPFCFYLINNGINTLSYPGLFFSTLKEKGWSSIIHYPNKDNPFFQFLTQNGLEAGYVGGGLDSGSGSIRGMNFLLNLECFGKVSFSDLASERYIPYALKSDAADRIFWLDGNPEFFKTLGADFKEQNVNGVRVCYDFSIKRAQELLISDFKLQVSHNQFQSAYLNDFHAGTFWNLDPSVIQKASLQIEFSRSEPLSKIILFPDTALHCPDDFSIQISENDADWKTVYETSHGQSVFWSGTHPFLKLVNPRMEIVLPEGISAKKCRILFRLDKRKADIAIREIVFIKKGNTISSQEWDRDKQNIINTVIKNGNQKVIVGDHWWENYFQSKKLVVDFISNQSVNNCGQPNSKLNNPSPLDFHKPHLFISEKVFSSCIENRLSKHQIAFSKQSFLFHDLYEISPTQTSALLYWNGLFLNEVNPTLPGGSFYYPYPPLSDLHPETKSCSYVFNNEFTVSSYFFQTDKKNRIHSLFFEVTPLKKIKNDYYLFIHYCDSKGKVLFQGDVLMEHFHKTTSAWTPEKKVLLQRDVSIPAQVSGEIFIKIGMWHPASGKQLSIESPGKKKEPCLLLGSFEI